MSNIRAIILILLIPLNLLSPAAIAQEATSTPAATQPAQGALYLRQKIQYFRMVDDPATDPRDIDKFVSTTSLTYGIRRNLSLTLDIPAAYEIRDGVAETDRELGLNDLAISLKYRPVQIDLNPIDSVRFALFGGVEIPSGDSGFSSMSWDPFIGGVFTAILGRHGVNQAIAYKFNTGSDRGLTRPGDGPDDALRYDTAYLFRIDPAVYAADTSAATYVTLELNGLYETNGDNEILLAPGLLYEARTFALEATVGVPIHQDVRRRHETRLVVTLGLRVLF